MKTLVIHLEHAIEPGRVDRVSISEGRALREDDARSAAYLPVGAMVSVELVDDEAPPEAKNGPTHRSTDPVRELLALLGPVGEVRADYIRGAASRLPASAIEGLAEVVSRRNLADPASYVVSTLTRELEARGS